MSILVHNPKRGPIVVRRGEPAGFNPNVHGPNANQGRGPANAQRERRTAHGAGVVFAFIAGLIAAAGLWHIAAWWFQ